MQEIIDRVLKGDAKIKHKYDVAKVFVQNKFESLTSGVRKEEE